MCLMCKHTSISPRHILGSQETYLPRRIELLQAKNSSSELSTLAKHARGMDKEKSLFRFSNTWVSAKTDELNLFDLMGEMLRFSR